MIRATAALTVSVSSESLMQQMKEGRTMPVGDPHAAIAAQILQAMKADADLPVTRFFAPMPRNTLQRPNSCVVFNAQEEIAALKAEVAQLNQAVDMHTQMHKATTDTLRMVLSLLGKDAP